MGNRGWHKLSPQEAVLKTCSRSTSQLRQKSQSVSHLQERPQVILGYSKYSWMHEVPTSLLGGHCWHGRPPGPCAHPPWALHGPPAQQPWRRGTDRPSTATVGTIDFVCHGPLSWPSVRWPPPPRAVVAASVLAPSVGFLGMG